MFRFAHPDYLWLLLVVPALLLVWLAAEAFARRRLARFGRPATLSPLTTGAAPARRRAKMALWLAAAACLALAAARPQFGSRLREESARGIEMMIAVDVSNSMLAEDFPPSRLERTRYALERLFEELDQDRVGLVVFAGEAAVQLPITADSRMAQTFAQRLSPALVSVQGTDIGRALSLAALSFPRRGEGDAAGRAIILITDGEGHDPGAIDVARRLAREGIRVFTLGIGTPEGSAIEIDGEPLRDPQGEVVVSKLDEELLRQIAAETDGLYVRATSRSMGLAEIVRAVRGLEEGELAALRFEEFEERYPALVWAALVLLLVEFLLPLSRFARFR